jgi:iron complex outermembrane recepter protein
MIISKFRTILFCGAASFALSAAATAQPATPPADAAADGGKVEKVTVTARRRAEELQKVPGAVTAVTGKRLTDELGAENTGALQDIVPNLNLVQGRGSSSSANIYIRGIGQPDALQTFDPGVGVYIDDVYISRIRGALFDIYDLDRIEVLRGPQGTLYGKNTIGGAIKLVTRRPGSEPEFIGSLTYGSYNNLEARARVSAPLIDETLSAAVAFYRASRDGYVEDSLIPGREYNDKDTWAGRASFYLTPSENFELAVNMDITHESPGLQVGKAMTPLFRTELATGVPTIIFTPAAGEFDFRSPISPTLPNSVELDHKGVGATATWTLSDSFTLKSITAARDLDSDDYVDIDASPFRLGDVFVGVRQNQFSQELQALWSGDRFGGVAGLFFLNENIQSDQSAFGQDLFTFLGFPFPAVRTVHDDLNLHSYAAFAQGDYALSDQWSLSGGLRYTSEQKRYFRTTSVNGGAPFAFSAAKDWEDLSPSLSLSYQASPDTLVYGRIAKGFKSGGFNGRANAATEVKPYDPETVWSYEAGVKTTFWDGRARTNAAVFFNDYKDFQARVGGTTPNDFPVINAGKLEQYGAEFEVTLVPSEAWLVQGTLGLLDSDYLEFFDNRFPGNDHSQQTPAFSPHATGRLDAQYTFALGGGSTLALGANANYRSETFLSVDNHPTLTQDGYWLVNARAVWRSEGGRFYAMLHGKNLTDEVYMVDAQEFSNVAGVRTAYFGAPVNVNLTVGVNY